MRPIHLGRQKESDVRRRWEMEHKIPIDEFFLMLAWNGLNHWRRRIRSLGWRSRINVMGLIRLICVSSSGKDEFALTTLPSPLSLSESLCQLRQGKADSNANPAMSTHSGRGIFNSLSCGDATCGLDSRTLSRCETVPVDPLHSKVSSCSIL